MIDIAKHRDCTDSCVYDDPACPALELAALRKDAARRDSSEALRERLLVAVRRADTATLRAVAALLEIA